MLPEPDLSHTTVHPPSQRQSKALAVLDQSQIEKFYHEIDKDNVGFVTLDQLADKLETVIDELTSTSSTLAKLPSDERLYGTVDVERDASGNQLQHFIESLFPDATSNIPKADFIAKVTSWNILCPTINTSAAIRPRIFDRIRALWEVEGPRIAFITFIIALQVGFGLWQMIKYIQSPTIREAFGWGVILSKTAAGAIYPTLFFLLLSMSRYFATLIRRFKPLPRILNWDRSQNTHVWLGFVGLGLATLHGIGYYTGSFVHGSRSSSRVALEKVFTRHNLSDPPRSYAQFVKELPGWSGTTALGLYWIIALLSIPRVRAWSWEVFQLGHLLMFPFIGLLCAHGTLAILQRPMLGYWLAFPVFLVLLERSSRIAHGIRKVSARLEVLDDNTCSITFDHPRGNWWNYEAGQYIFLQVPAVSYWQWHPFTVSSCNGKQVQVHIQTGGNWTRRLRTLPNEEPIIIGVDGPFGAPSQRFYEFDRGIVLGAGVGITPFSAIITDLEQKIANGIDPWAHTRHTDGLSRNEEKPFETDKLPASFTTPKAARTSKANSISESTHAKRRVDFHWIVREREDLLWFSSLLNRAHDLSRALPPSSLNLKINTYITDRHKDLSTYIFRYLLDSYRSPAAPCSPLTGLKMPSQLGRPDVGAILADFHQEMKRIGWTGGKVGVFFCGNSHIGRLLAETCTRLNLAARKDGTRIKYVFMMEVFG